MEHLTESWRQVRVIQSHYGGQFESSHKTFKNVYRKNSKRVRSAMDKIVLHQNHNIETVLSTFVLTKVLRKK